MKVTEHYNNALAKNTPKFSYEIIPPTRGKSLKDLIEIIEKIAPYDPAFIDVTAHAATVTYKENPDGTIQKRKIKKRPGTIGICGVIQNRFNIDTVAHVLCQGFTKSETEDALIELGFLGIHNILALRGDETNFVKPKDTMINEYANDLVAQIHDINRGVFLEGTDLSSTFSFCTGVAGYPEKHFTAPNLKEDIKNLKQKVDAGAEYITTQMFFNNQSFYDFQGHCTEAGINIPIIPGIKVITSVKQLTNIPKRFYIDLPDGLVDEIMNNQKHVKEIGKRWALQQSEDLLNSGVPLIHYYVMNSPETVTDIVQQLQK